MTRAQERAWRELWPRFGIAYDDDHGLAQAFVGDQRRILEIGFGNGESLLQQAAADPAAQYFGIEVHEPGIGHCLLGIQRLDIANLTLLHGDALEIMARLPDGCIDRLNLYFPDPWPKKRHHKRRLVRARFLDLAARVMKPGATLHLATDWPNYAEHIDDVMAGDDRFQLLERREHEGEAPLARPETKFERRGLKLGHHICDWIYRRR